MIFATPREQGPSERTSKKFKTFMRFAVDISKLSTCKRLQVGTIITDERMERVLGIGYNGSASGMPNKCDSKVPGHCGCIHSEVNALIKCGSPDRKKLMFVTTKPCINCAKLIVNSGFKIVFYRDDYRKEEPEVFEMFNRNEIRLVQLIRRRRNALSVPGNHDHAYRGRASTKGRRRGQGVRRGTKR